MKNRKPFSARSAENDLRFSVLPFFPVFSRTHLFCGRDKRKIKALHFDKDGFVLLQKRLDGRGRFQWPTNASEARQLTRQQFRWLTEGLSIDQPKAIHAGDKRKDF